MGAATVPARFVAKLSAPRQVRIAQRPRVHDLIDEALRAGVCWLAAPAGYGKTTAVVDYLHGAKAPYVWYRVDEGDQDIARFYHYLARTLRSEKTAEAMPVFGSEYAERPREFARMFFRAYFEHLEPGTRPGARRPARRQHAGVPRHAGGHAARAAGWHPLHLPLPHPAAGRAERACAARPAGGGRPIRARLLGHRGAHPGRDALEACGQGRCRRRARLGGRPGAAGGRRRRRAERPRRSRHRRERPVRCAGPALLPHLAEHRPEHAAGTQPAAGDQVGPGECDDRLRRGRQAARTPLSRADADQPRGIQSRRLPSARPAAGVPGQPALAFMCRPKSRRGCGPRRRRSCATPAGSTRRSPWRCRRAPGRRRAA